MDRKKDVYIQDTYPTILELRNINIPDPQGIANKTLDTICQRATED